MILIQANQPVQFDINNFRRVHKNLAKGELFLIELEVTEEDWIRLGGFPKDAIGEAQLVWTERTGVDKRMEAEPKSKGAYAAFWRVLMARGFFNAMPVREFVRHWCAQHSGLPLDSSVKAILYKKFGVDSLSKISPQDLARELDAFNSIAVWKNEGSLLDIFEAAVKAQQGSN